MADSDLTLFTHWIRSGDTVEGVIEYGRDSFALREGNRLLPSCTRKVDSARSMHRSEISLMLPVFCRQV